MSYQQSLVNSWLWTFAFVACQTSALIIRDVLAFCRPAEKKATLQWQSYYEPISYLEFDGPEWGS